MDNTTTLIIGILSFILIISIIMAISLNPKEEKKHHTITCPPVHTPKHTTTDKEKEDAIESVKKYYENVFNKNISSSQLPTTQLQQLSYFFINIPDVAKQLYIFIIERLSKTYSYTYIK